jgi:hypothetical protein
MKKINTHKRKKFRPGVVAYTYNPSCSGSRDQEFTVQSHPGEKLARPYLNQ